MSDARRVAPADWSVPLHRPTITGRELDYLARVVDGVGVASDGPFTVACARLLEQKYGIARVLLTPSCTAALELAVMACDLGPGDEAILPSWTFPSTANAVLRVGARPVFVDVRPETMNLDESHVAAAVTPRTRAILPVHYAGVACAMGPILETAAAHGLSVIEDAAQAVGSSLDDRPLGSIGRLGAYSFHGTKNVTCGEGGALCVNDPGLVERAEVLREKGTDRARFLRGEVGKYSWRDVGSSFVPSELSCAFLLAQLEAIDRVTTRLRRLDALYRDRLAGLERRGAIRLPVVPPGCRTNHHLFYVIVNDAATRDAMLTYLRRKGVGAAFHFVPLHTAPMGARLGYRPGDLPRTEDLGRRLVRLPFYPGLSARDAARVATTVESFFDAVHERAVGGVAS
jgi:dTDP-4-amino-4,6-dideoxygalactose transaminase